MNSIKWPTMDQRIANAVRMALASENDLTVAKIARRNNIPRSILRDQLSDFTTQYRAYINQQILLKEEKGALAK